MPIEEKWIIDVKNLLRLGNDIDDTTIKEVRKRI